MRAVLLALEGVDVHGLERFTRQTPTISRLRERGVWGDLESTIPSTPASAWTSVVTGTDPSVHGIVDERLDRTYPGDGRPASPVDVRRPTLWDYLTGEGGDTIVCGMPMTDPPGPVSGTVVPGRPAGRTGSTAGGDPRSRALERASPDGRLWTLNQCASPADVPALIDTRRRIARDLLEEEAWDLAVIHVPVVDPALLERADAVGDDRAFEAAVGPAYRAADRLVESVLEATPPGTTVVGCSPMGCRRADGYVVHLNEVLAEAGFLEAGPAAASPPSTGASPDTVAGPRESTSERFAEGASAGSPPDRVEGTLSERTREPSTDSSSRWSLPSWLSGRPSLEDVRTLFGRAAVPVGFADALGDGRHHPSFDGGDDAGEEASRTYQWSSSRAFCSSATGAGVRVNLAGREPEGRVVHSSYETTRDRLIDHLRGMTDPAGNPVFEFVCKREHLFDGPFVRTLPDVLYSTIGTDCVISPFPPRQRSGGALTGGRSADPFTPSTGVRPTGVGGFFAVGPGIRPPSDALEPRLTATDVAPLVMAALGRPIPRLMTGAAPSSVIEGDYERRTYTTVTHGMAVDDPTFDDATLDDRLEEYEYR